jgi:hypothetical protein
VASRTRPQPQTASQIARRVDACNALTAVSQAAHQASTAALLGAGPSALLGHLARIRAMLDAVAELPAICRPPETGGGQ